MNLEANTFEGIRPLPRMNRWDAVDIMWCDGSGVDGYLAPDFYGEVLCAGWYYEPLVSVEQDIFATEERCEGLRGPFDTSEQAFQGACAEGP